MGNIIINIDCTPTKLRMPSVCICYRLLNLSPKTNNIYCYWIKISIKYWIPIGLAITLPPQLLLLFGHRLYLLIMLFHDCITLRPVGYCHCVSGVLQNYSLSFDYFANYFAMLFLQVLQKDVLHLCLLPIHFKAGLVLTIPNTSLSCACIVCVISCVPLVVLFLLRIPHLGITFWDGHTLHGCQTSGLYCVVLFMFTSLWELC